jgi:hypothetical protein
MTNTTTSAKKLTFADCTKLGPKALEIARGFYKQKMGVWKICLKAAWAKLKAIHTGVVKFIPKTVKKGVEAGTVRIANILPIEDYTGFKTMHEKFVGLFRAIDADKLAETGEVKSSIISFYLDTCL